MAAFVCMSVSGQPLLIGSFLCLFYSSFSRSLSSDFFQFPLLFTFFFFSIFFLRTASFHGDTNGLATIPIITAIEEIASSKYPGHVLIIGLDANTYNSRTADYQSVSIFLFFCPHFIKVSTPTPATRAPRTSKTFFFLLDTPWHARRAPLTTEAWVYY